MQAAQEMAKRIEENPDLESQMKDDPVATLKAMSTLPLQTDVWIYRAAVFSLGLVSFVSVVGTLALAIYDKSTPDGVLVMAGTGFGALAALLKAPDRG